MDEPENIVQQARGRAQFGRNMGQVKTPHLLDGLSDLIEEQAALLREAEEALRDIAETPGRRWQRKRAKDILTKLEARK